MSKATKLSGLLVQQLGPKLFSNGPGLGRVRPIGAEARKFSTMAEAEEVAAPPQSMVVPPPRTVAGMVYGRDGKEFVSYWGVVPPKVTKEDGTPWKWNSFMPLDTYSADTSLDLKKHHEPTNLTDKIAYSTVQTLKIPVRLFFQKRHMCHAMLLETVAAVPGMVAGMLLHFRSLRRFEHSAGWIKALLEEAENERMHLMTFIDLSEPKWHERALVMAVQGLFFNAYFLAYLASPKLAHRIVGYLEEEAVISYTAFLEDLEKGEHANMAAPAIAKDYWRLPEGSTLKDVVTVIRADEAHHRDLNHFASDIQKQGHQLRDFPAPIGFH